LTADHPFAAGRPDAATFKSWALLFRTRGHQAVHHHPGAWLTGVYYAKVPPRLAGPGGLRVGSLPAAAGVKPPWRVFDVQPTPGTLVLFPSYVPHETIPSGSEDLRISIAFDVTRASR
jgi:oxalate decarboxylase/phosphoglucose isomerase-like protein (cupin superfamily)